MSRSLFDDTLRIRGGALIVSIAFHLAIFYALSQMETPSPRSFASKDVKSPMRIRAQLIAPQPITDTSPHPTVAPVPDPVVDTVQNTEAPVDIRKASPKRDVVTQPAIVETTDELLPRDEAPAIESDPVTQQIPDIVLSSEANRINAVEADYQITSDTGPQDGAFGNVFNPRLRQRLQNNHNHTSTARLGGPAETRDIHGDRRVAVNDKRCMMAKQSMRPGEATDWYLTSCGGLDEGEKMLRRVEQNWRNRRE